MPDYEKLYADKRYREEKGRTFLYCDIFLSLYKYVMDVTNARSIGVDETVIDWGCGKGLHAMEFSGHGMDVVGLVDIAPNCLNDEVKSIFEDVFQDRHIKDARPRFAHWSYCADVLEHIDESDIDSSILNIVRHTKRPGFVFLNVATNPDLWEDEELHATIKSHGWWMDKFVELVPGMCIFTSNMSNNALSTFWHLE